MKIVDLDGATGIWRWEVVGLSACTADAPQMAIRSDGAVVVTAPGNTSGFPELMILDGRTGQLLESPSIPLSTYTSLGGQVSTGYSRIGPPMVDSQGATYLEYRVRHVVYPAQS